MKIEEFFTRNGKGQFYFDDYGNCYVNTDQNLSSPFWWLEQGSYFISKEEYDKLSEEVIIPDDPPDVSGVRRPYYRMRGKPVTVEQAFEIIRRTDNYFCLTPISDEPGYIGCMNFDNWFFDNHSPRGYGWIQADGTVGVNTITQRFPTTEEFILEWFEKKTAFPYLDLIIAVTGYDEDPRFYADVWGNKVPDTEEDMDRHFFDGIDMGIYIHEQKLEILNRDDTIAVYQKYDALYGNPREKFEPEYFEDHGIVQADSSYLKRCIEAYGLNAEETEFFQQYVKRHDGGTL